MLLQHYLIETFQFNDRSNKMVLEKIKLLPEQSEAIRLFSHLINSQNKWMARITQYPNDPQLDWWEPLYNLERLEEEWNKSLGVWIAFLETKTEEELLASAHFIGYDGRHWVAPLKDIALQLNYHSIHHRAQIQSIIRNQGVTPDFVDYIGMKYRRVE